MTTRVRRHIITVSSSRGATYGQLIDPTMVTERGLGALAASKHGGALFVFRSGKWRPAGPREQAKAEWLALHHPQALVQYGATPPPRRRRRGKSISKRKVRSR